MTEFRQPLQVQSHLEMQGILVQLGHIQRTYKLAPQINLNGHLHGAPHGTYTKYPLSARVGRDACQVSRPQRTHSRP